MRKGGLERETGEGIYEILTDGWSFFALISGHHIALFLAIYLFSLFHSRAYFAPGLTVLFSSDTPDYSRLSSSAALIIFFYFFFFFFVFLLLHRYVNEGMRQFEGLFYFGGICFSHHKVPQTTDYYACSQGQTDRPWGRWEALCFPHPEQNGRDHDQGSMGPRFYEFFSFLSFLSF